MIFYFLPEPTIHGGIKVGFQFTAMLRQLGLDVVVVTPNGSAPQWFSSEVPVLRRENVLPKLSPKDRVMFSLPHDYQELKQTGARLVFHCQGTDELIIPVLQDESVEILTCWEQASEFVFELGRDSENVGISISRIFFYSGQLKKPGTYAVMPRRGSLPHPNKLNGFEKREIHEMKEGQVAGTLKKTSGFLALSENEWFGLPALEAMAAGCLVVTPKTIGGGEYLIDGKNCLVEELDNLAERMSHVLNREEDHIRLRQEAINTSYKYHPRAQFQHLQKMINGGGLKFLN